MHGEGGAVLTVPSAIHVSGNYAYVSSNSKNDLEVIDISNASLPVHGYTLTNVPGVTIQSPPVNVAANYLYFLGSNAIHIINISNASSPIKVGTINTALPPFQNQITAPQSVSVVGNIAYVTWNYKGAAALEIFDISNPAQPVRKSKMEAGVEVGSIWGPSARIDVSGDLACVSGGNGNNVSLINISNPASPVLLGNVSNGAGGALLNGPRSVKIIDNYVFVISFFSNALEVLDISNTSAPTHKSSLTSGLSEVAMQNPTDVFVLGNYAYVTSIVSNSLQIVDISDPEHPVARGSIRHGEGQALLNYPTSVFVQGSYAYVTAATSNALEIIDISNPMSPVHRGSISTGANNTAPFLTNAQTVFVSGIYAYVASAQSNALQIINVSNPALPSAAGNIVDGNGVAPFLSGARSVYVTNANGVSTAYVVSYFSNALEIINVTNPNAPAHLGTLKDGAGGAMLQGPWRIVVSGSDAYVTSALSNALEVINVSDPLNPSHKGKLVHGTSSALLNGATGIFISDQRAFVTATGSSSLQVLDIVNSATPTVVATLTNGTGGALLNAPFSASVQNNYAYVASQQSGALDIIYLYGSKISGFSPASGSAGSTMTITGQNFTTHVTATLNGQVLPINNLTSTSITVTLPTDARIGKVAVKSHNNTSYSAADFMVIPAPQMAANVTQSSFTASWTDVGALYYSIDVSTDNFATFVTGLHNQAVYATSFEVGGLTPGTTYQYRVRASNGVATSQSSNAAFATTIPRTPTAIEPTLIGQAGFVANWTSSPGAQSYYLDVAYDPDFTNFLVGYNNLLISKALATAQLVTGLNPYTLCYYRVRSATSSGSSPSSNVISIRTRDVAPPVMTSASTPNPTTVILGNTPIINITVTDNVIVKSATLFYKGISSKSFKSESMIGPGGTGGNYTITIQADWYDALGLEYYFKAVDDAGNESKTESYFLHLVTPSLSIPALPSGNQIKDYRMIAFPFQLSTGNKVTTVYSGVPWNDNTKAAMWWWNPTAQNGKGAYDQYGVVKNFETIDAGKGYWTITSTSVTPQLSNVSAPRYSRSDLFSMTLKPNWNAIGNPYPVAISWSDVIDYNKEANINSLSPLSVYDGTGYKTVSGTTMLEPFTGGFVKNSSASDVVIKIPFPGQSLQGGRSGSSTANLDEDAWRIFLYIKQGDFENQLGGFGMHPEAKLNVDPRDNFNPPKLFDSPEINFENTDNPLAPYSFETVPTTSDHAWHFISSGKINEPTAITWNKEIFTKEGQQVVLLDRESLTAIDMTQQNEYNFKMTANRRFSVFVGSHVDQKLVSENIVIGLPYPNPVTQGGAIVHIGLPDADKEYDVHLEIYNMHGVLMEDNHEILRPGIQQMKIFSLSEPAVGIYYYKITIRSVLKCVVHTGKIVRE